MLCTIRRTQVSALQPYHRLAEEPGFWNMNLLTKALWQLSILVGLFFVAHETQVLERVNSTLEKLAPVGYQDDFGFHFGYPKMSI